ncbi:MAG: hypothetical protein Q8P41_20505 [Pseudomonadota bacterium]|nr:hypothetical protein [Pseudomonadota bacterium]
MEQPSSGHPSLDALEAGLAAVLRAPVEIVHRERNLYQSSFPSEVVTCRAGGGLTANLLCKYGAGRERTGFGHRGGIGYESAVYRELLEPLGAGAPAFYGSYTEPGGTWIVLEYLDEAHRLDLTADPRALGRAATWVGGFHSLIPTDQDSPPFARCSAGHQW